MNACETMATGPDELDKGAENPRSGTVRVPTVAHEPSIAAAIIALDEERNLAELLPALRWTDEVVVVDGGSRDATLQIARRHGCRVASRPLDSFARQRNFALRMARSDWVLSIDADERPTPGLVAEIRQRIARTRAAALRVPIRSTIFGRRLRFAGTQDDCPIRLFRRTAGHWAGDVHEVLQVHGPVAKLRHGLMHHTLPDLAAFLAKMHRYTLLEAQARVAAGRTPTWQDIWVAPPREVLRRLICKGGFLDGPAGWAFCLLSGLSAWALAREHWRLLASTCSALPAPAHVGGLPKPAASRPAANYPPDRSPGACELSCPHG